MAQTKLPIYRSIKYIAATKYNERMRDILAGIETYVTHKPITVGKICFMPDIFRKYFKYIFYNDSNNSFIFVLNNGNPIELIRMYVNVNQYNNFIDQLKFNFDLTKIEYYYGEGLDNHTIHLKHTSNNYQLLKSLFLILNEDKSFEYIYMKHYKLIT